MTKMQPVDQTAPGLFEDLVEAPDRFDPIVALRLAAQEAQARAVPLDIRAVTDARLAPVAIVRVAADADAVTVHTALSGMTGPLSPLPLAYTELAATDRRRGAGGLGAFFDLFAGRLTLLFAAASSKYNLPDLLQWVPPTENRMLNALRAVIGGGTSATSERLPLGPEATLRYAGLFGQRTRSALGLQAVAEAELGLPVRVAQFHRRWRPMPFEDQTSLNGLGHLGQNTVAGAYVPNRTGQVRLVVGPVRYADFLSLALGQPRLTALAQLTQLYLGPVLEFDIQIVLDRRDVRETQLGSVAQLGWNCWALTAEPAQDSDEVVIDGALAANPPPIAQEVTHAA
ncbi:type VI secretion system baseplate subunit TssG [Roseobacter weihaiensis]|uniref:type VI secretion system baseplate subunit TssG n=1 Tax=Roseobacter weihaiensis TaxID=2763262 RepID=UPI001D09B5F3|nr:type VI secretion system baseplate subunit TssG [Roseobacter sp. H9]